MISVRGVSDLILQLTIFLVELATDLQCSMAPKLSQGYRDNIADNIALELPIHGQSLIHKTDPY